MPAARLLAFYLPQYHPIPENDEWWGKGFTEWTNVIKARPLFPGHYQPRLPSDLGFYDLRVPETRQAQADLARAAGIEAFCYYHYWYAGKRLLERPFLEVVASGKPDLPFCLCWANQTWTGVWHGAPNRILIEQTYPGPEDHRRHFEALREAFRDPRYFRVDGRPVFVIFRPTELPNAAEFIRQWRALAAENGLPGIHFIAHLLNLDTQWDYKRHGFDSCVMVNSHRFATISMHEVMARSRQDKDAPGARDLYRSALTHGLWRKFRNFTGRFQNVLLYRHALPFLLEGCAGNPDFHPCLIPNWDNTARSNTRGMVLHDSTPELFRQHLREALNLVQDRPLEQRLIFIKSWNEWAEGNYLEPDQKYGHGYLDVLRQERVLIKSKNCRPL